MRGSCGLPVALAGDAMTLLSLLPPQRPAIGHPANESWRVMIRDSVCTTFWRVFALR